MAPFKFGIDHFAPDPDELTFEYVGLPGVAFFDFRVVDGHLVIPDERRPQLINTTAEAERIRLDDYDFIVNLAGMSRLDARLYYVEGQIAPISHAMIRDVVLGSRLTSQIFEPMLETLSSRSKLIQIGGPLVSHRDVQKGTVPIYRDADDVAYAEYLVGTVKGLSAQSIDDPTSHKVLLQPECTLSENGFHTLDTYIRGGLSYAGRPKTPDDPDYLNDTYHANADFGIVMVEHLIQTLRRLRS